MRYCLRVIQSFSCEETAKIYEGKTSRRLPMNLVSVMRRKLEMLDGASALIDLRIPPSNRLEALKGDRAGQHSIRINDQYRICFFWTNKGASDIEMTDYH